MILGFGSMPRQRRASNAEKLAFSSPVRGRKKKRNTPVRRAGVEPTMLPHSEEIRNEESHTSRTASGRRGQVKGHGQKELPASRLACGEFQTYQIRCSLRHVSPRNFFGRLASRIRFGLG